MKRIRFEVVGREVRLPDFGIVVARRAPAPVAPVVELPTAVEALNGGTK